MMGIFRLTRKPSNRLILLNSKRTSVFEHPGRNEKWCQFVTAMINHVQYLTVVIFYFKSSQIGLKMLKACDFFYKLIMSIVSIPHTCACSAERFKCVSKPTNQPAVRPSNRLTEPSNYLSHTMMASSLMIELPNIEKWHLCVANR